MRDEMAGDVAAERQLNVIERLLAFLIAFLPRSRGFRDPKTESGEACAALTICHPMDEPYLPSRAVLRRPRVSGCVRVRALCPLTLSPDS